MDDPLDRAAVMTELQALLLETPALHEFVEGIAVAAAQHVVPAASATVSMQRDGRPYAVAASDPLAAACDQAEYAANDGPCLEAIRRGASIVSDDLTTESRWPQWRAAASQRGFLSVAAVSRPVRPGVSIALNLYARATSVFDEEAMRTADMYATEIARTMGLYLRGTDQAELNADLRAAIASRAVIDQAIGVILAQNRCTQDEAMAILRAASQHRNVKLRDIAASIIEAVTGGPPSQAGTFHERAR
ncbi:RNA-binding protein [Cellulomonas chitinilytica]|uniref:RNA-binding protein n=1 Tax=Cellulomonas chitinilytica TaxID=398759 RepID=A0A919P210_9CELL|nr:GAF and ANTAR domain-containing protein [Cellulomonas chitinilytica]GIG20221.1 RNA-binding protein [Cellulomonas chitinilytica]